MTSMTLPTMLAFTANYQVERAGDDSLEVREFRRKPDTTSSGIALQVRTQSVVLRVRPTNGEAWVGRFHGGPEGIDGVFATPNTEVLCVIVRGQGYWVPVYRPATFEVVRSIPIKEVLHDRRAIFFVSFTRLSAYGADGLMWSTEDVSWDGIKNVRVASTAIRGVGWDSPARREVPFSVDIATGRVEGGSSPATYAAPK
jgi:hypothetical protein